MWPHSCLTYLLFKTTEAQSYYTPDYRTESGIVFLLQNKKGLG